MSTISWKYIFCGISTNSFQKQMYFYEKNLVYIEPFWCTAKLDKFFTIYFVLTKEMAQIWQLWQELLKSQIWKPEDSNGRFEPLTNSGRSLTGAYKLKELKSSSHISAANWLKIFLIHVIKQSYTLQCCYQCSNFTSLRWWC